MSSSPIVTVAIITFSRAHIVQRAIRSALKQTVSDIEVIVVDDCSTDETRRSVGAITDGRVRYVRHERNKGPSAARNTAIRLAASEYVAFLDDDDQWRPNMLEEQLKEIGSRDAILTGAVISGQKLKCHKDTLVTLDDLRIGNEFDPSSLMARTAVLRELWFDESLRIGEDWDLFVRLAQRAAIGYVRKPLLLYDDGSHERATSEAKYMSIEEIAARTGVLLKHKDFLGPFWYKYHQARFFLSYLGFRRDKFHQLGVAVRRCGVWPVCAVLYQKACHKLKDGRQHCKDVV